MIAISEKIKRIFLVGGLFFILQSGSLLYGQQVDYEAEQPPMPGAYIGGGLGINDYGFGVNLEVPVAKHLSIAGNVGLGGWGYKYGASLNFYPIDIVRGNEFSIGLSGASGLMNFVTEMETEPDDVVYNVSLDLNKVCTLNMMYTYNLKIGRRNKLAFSGGYAICLTDNTYEVNDDIILNDTSKQLMEIMQPGGVILGVKFMFGLK